MQLHFRKCFRVALALYILRTCIQIAFTLGGGCHATHRGRWNCNPRGTGGGGRIYDGNDAPVPIAPAPAPALDPPPPPLGLREILEDQSSTEELRKQRGEEAILEQLTRAFTPREAGNTSSSDWNGAKFGCYGATHHPEWLSQEDRTFLRENVIFGMITGHSYGKRIQLSLCSWLAHVPPENLLLFTDTPPAHMTTNPVRHEVETPYGVFRPLSYDMTSFFDFLIVDAGKELYSAYYEEGYYSSMVNKQKKTNYTLGWVKAQYRFAFALHTITRPQFTSKYKFSFLLDDDTFVHFPNLVKLLRATSPSKSLYLNSKGWGGSGHLFTATAASRLHPKLKGCVQQDQIRRWGSSDGMLMKCFQKASITPRNEPKFHPCGARAIGLGYEGTGGTLNPELGMGALKTLITLHMKLEYQNTFPKDPSRKYPDEFRAWRVAAHYNALYTLTKESVDLLLAVSSCGMCEARMLQPCLYHEKKHADAFEIWQKSRRDPG